MSNSLGILRLVAEISEFEYFNRAMFWR